MKQPKIPSVGIAGHSAPKMLCFLLTARPNIARLGSVWGERRRRRRGRQSSTSGKHNERYDQGRPIRRLVLEQTNFFRSRMGITPRMSPCKDERQRRRDGRAQGVALPLRSLPLGLQWPLRMRYHPANPISPKSHASPFRSAPPREQILPQCPPACFGLSASSNGVVEALRISAASSPRSRRDTH
jgi:hypothetical protein